MNSSKMNPDEKLEQEIEELEALICEDMEWGVRPGISLHERCQEALDKARREEHL